MSQHMNIWTHVNTPTLTKALVSFHCIAVVRFNVPLGPVRCCATAYRTCDMAYLHQARRNAGLPGRCLGRWKKVSLDISANALVSRNMFSTKLESIRKK
jgi:hypothetical protein